MTECNEKKISKNEMGTLKTANAMIKKDAY